MSVSAFKGLVRAIQRSWVAFLGLGFTLLLATQSAWAAPCYGRILNPVTDVCWSCLFPITIGPQIPVSDKGSLPDVQTDAPALCACGSGLATQMGINFSFWEPIRTAEMVRHSGCFPSLGGVTMPVDAMNPIDHGRSAPHALTRQHTSFWQVHWYHTPWLFILEALLDNRCLETGAWDLAYLSELDPLWDDTLASFILSPDAALFASASALGACAVDCTLATAGLPNQSLYWCAGCQGSVFPLSGWIGAQTSNVQAWLLLAQRFAMKLSREGILWSAHGQAGQCGPYAQPLMDKRVWRTQLVYPARRTDDSAGSCCDPLGRSTLLWNHGKSWAISGEDGALLLYRKRDCCMGVDMSDVASMPSNTTQRP